MISFLTNKQAAEKIADLEQRLEVLQRDSDAAQAQLGELQTENANLSERVATLSQENETLSGQVLALTSERDQAAEALAAATIQLEGFDGRVEAGVLARFESMGGAAVPASNEQTLTEDQIRTQFSEMKAGPARSAFFKKHQSVLSIRK